MALTDFAGIEKKTEAEIEYMFLLAGNIMPGAEKI